jgi:DNA uptake protein ComE-like DNA-binding protein
VDETEKQGNGDATAAGTAAGTALTNDSGTREWLLDEPAGPLHHEAPDEQESRIAELENALEARENELEQTLEEREAEFAQGVRELEAVFNERRSKLEERVTALDQELEDREAELREQAAQREELLGRINELEAELADAERNAPARPMAAESDIRPTAAERTGKTEGTQLDVNSATFEELRDLGLSITQSARIIAHRDTRDRFRSLDELNGIPGLPKETRATLRSQLRV